MKRLGFLDSIRGIAALTAMIGHYFSYPHISLGLRNFGVGLFFLASGFIIPASIEHSTVKKFWIRRFWRLFPLYWANIALWLVYINFTNLSFDPVKIIANLSMLPDLFHQDVMVMLFWTLNIEMIFYILVTVLFITGILKRAELLAVTMLSSAILFKFTALYCLALMFAGTVIYRLYKEEAIKKKVLVGILLLVVCMEIVARGSDMSIFISDLLVYAVFVGLVFSGKQGLKFFRFMGTISYSLYLNHVLIATALLTIGNANRPAWILATLIFSTATYYAIERPAINFGKYLTTGEKIKPPD